MKEISDVKEIRSILLGILHHVDSFCKENGIKYFLCGGSAIGAIRHHGFIPWDDDIDIMMLRNDYQRFISLYKTNDRSEYQIHNCEFDKYFYVPFTKIENANTIIKERVNKTSKIGLSIDIFPIDDLPNNRGAQEKIYRKSSLLMAIYNLKQIKFDAHRQFTKNLALLIGRMLLSPIPLSFISKKLSRFPSRFSFPSSEFCGIVIWGYGTKEINLKSNYTTCLLADFEGALFPVPVGYDNYLSAVYGDYMKLPPEDKQITHHSYVAFWK